MTRNAPASKDAHEPVHGILCVIGDPVHHSLSPLFQNAALRHLGLPFEYCAVRCSEAAGLRRFLRRARELRLRGLNVTTPLKEAAARLLIASGSADEEVRWTRSANTLIVGRRLTGGSTDGRGGMRWLGELGLTRRASILLLGAGAAARSLLWHLNRRGWRRLDVVTRRPAALRRKLADARAAARIFTPEELGLAGPGPGPLPAQSGRRPRLLEPDPPGEWEILISTWPPGTLAGPARRALKRLLSSDAVVLDLNYGAGRDDLHRWAARQGYAAHDGRGFLLHQGALSFQMWTHRRPPLDIMRAALGLAARG